jgi:transglutaminase-like putative cysteine protease
VELVAQDPERYLGADDVIDHTAPGVVALAAELRASHPEAADYARAAYEWVRDSVAHCVDVGDPRVTVSASDVLREGVGLCYTKSHLLVALLRAQGIPAGLCYQRLQGDTAQGDMADDHMLHGLVAVRLDGGWHRVDPRGNKPGVDAQFSLGEERLAWMADPARGEIDYPTVYVTAVPEVLAALRAHDDALALCAGGLPSGLSA